jgi:hypothetical protein
MDIYLPTLHWFAMGNPFSGSCGEMRFYAWPNVAKLNAKEVDFDNSSILCKLWHGPYCYEKSTVEKEQTFPMSEAGREALRQWLIDNV